MLNARKEFKRVVRQVEKIRKSFDLKNKQAQHPQPVPKILKIYKEAQSEIEKLIKLAKKYPDLNMEVQELESELNSITAAYEKFKMEGRDAGRRRRR